MADVKYHCVGCGCDLPRGVGLVDSPWCEPCRLIEKAKRWSEMEAWPLLPDRFKGRRQEAGRNPPASPVDQQPDPPPPPPKPVSGYEPPC